MRVLFLPLYDRRWASSRYRAYAVAERIGREGIEAAVLPPPAKPWERGPYLARCLAAAARADVVYIQKKLFPLPILHALRRINPRLVFDFDDALFARPSDVPAAAFRRRQVLGRLALTLRLVRHVVASNGYLADYARPRARAVTVIPTALDLDELPPRAPRPPGPVQIGWIGRRLNLVHLAQLVPSLHTLRARVGDRFVVHVVMDGVDEDPFVVPGVPVVNTVWSAAREYALIDTFSIGVMPLVDDEWSRGKLGFKLVQYMARSVAAVASTLGTRDEVITDGVSGLLARDADDWARALERLVVDEDLRARLGAAGRCVIEERYSFAVTVPRLAAVLEEVAAS
jgi:glycosyltransferase involved in cell wall biosynthesis